MLRGRAGGAVSTGNKLRMKMKEIEIDKKGRACCTYAGQEVWKDD